MDPELKKAACDGNVKFLTKAVESAKPQDYWLSRFIPTQDGERCAGNILHLAVWNNRKKFVTQALSSSLPEEVRQQLLTQQETAGELSNSTPALLAIEKRKVGCAEILTEESRAELIKDLLDDNGNSPLFLAVENRLPKVAINLLACQGPLSSRGHGGLTALHVWPRVFLLKFKYGRFVVTDRRLREVSEKLFERLRDQLTTVTDNGLTILHKWVQICSESRAFLVAGPEKRIEQQFELFFQYYRGDAVKLMLATDRDDGNNPLHYTAMCTSEDAAILIARKLIDLYKKYQTELSAQTPEAAPEEQKAASDASTSLQNHDPPWLMKNNNGDTPFLLAIHNKREKLALDLLSTDPVNSPSFLDDQKNPLVLAAENEYDELAARLVESILTSPLKSSPPAWIKACEDGRLSVVRAFVKSSEFRAFCAKERDTPLHHIQLKSLKQYKNFLRSDEFIEKQINTQNKDGATPLHKAIERGDRKLAEALLKAGADYSIQNEAEKTAMELMAEKSRVDIEWRKWCQRVGIDPVKLTYGQLSEYWMKLREVLLVVATLLAAITFQAGFTLPGGLNQNSGEAILAKNAAFLVFLLADAFAMWCSVLVLFCLIWSFFCKSEKSIIVIDRSMWILLASLHSTLVAFMSGVFTVISHDSLWAITIIIVLCSILGLVAIDGEILYTLLNLLPSTSNERRLSKLVNMLQRGKVPTLMDNISKNATCGRKAFASMNKSSEAHSTQEHAVQIEQQMATTSEISNALQCMT